MTATKTNPRAILGRRPGRLLAAAVTVGLASTAIVAAGGGTAGAAPLPQAQSVGNYLDATLGGNTLDAIAKLKYAKAKAPGSNGTQNPLDATLLNALDLPLTGALQLPSLAGINLGAVTQKARANVNGQSYGQAGTALDSGGVEVTDKDSDDKAGNATIDLSATALAGNSPIQIPGGASLAALGGVTAEIGGISSVASTPKGYGKKGATAYQIANLDLSIGSPLLGQTLGTVLGQVTSAFSSANTALGAIIGGLTGCTLTNPDVSQTLTLAGGALVIDAEHAKITVDLKALLDTLGVNLNSLPPNTDLIDYLLAYLTDPNGLAKGLQSLVDSIADPLLDQFTTCTSKLPSPLDGLFKTLGDALAEGKTTLEGLVSNVVTQLTSAAGVNPLKPLGDLLQKLIDIGVNVQPNGKAGTYTDPLAKTPKQGTEVVKGQTIVRAIEVNVAAGAGASLGGGIPSLGDLGIGSLTGNFTDLGPLAAPIHQVAPGDTGILTLALANAAAGPSTAPAAAPPADSTTPGDPSTSVPGTNIPTGVPAGAAANNGGSPVLPLIVLLLGLTILGGGYLTYRTRGKFMP